MESWDAKYEKEGKIWGETPTDGAKRFVKLLAEGTKYILDVGCGYGRDVLYFASLGYQVTGIDPSKSAVEMASSSIKDSGMNIEFFQDDCLNLSFPSENIDAIWSANLIHLLSEAERLKTVREMVRVLKPRGTLGLYVLSSLDREEDYSEGNKKSPRKFDKVELEKIMGSLDIITLEELDEEENHPDGKVHHHIKWLAVAKKR